MHLKRTGKIIIGCSYSLIYKSSKMMSRFETLDYIFQSKCSIRSMNGSVPAQGSESPLKANIFRKHKTAPVLTVSRIKDSLTKSLQKYFKISVQEIPLHALFSPFRNRTFAIYKYRILPYYVNVAPWNYNILTFPENAHYFSFAVNNN